MTKTMDMKRLKSIKPIFPDWSFLKLAIKVVVPIILTQMISASITFLDNFIIGHTKNSSTNLAAIAISNEIWFFMIGIIWGLAYGFTIFLAQFYGADKIDKYKVMQRNMSGVNLIFMVIATILVITIPEKLISIYSHDVAVQHEGTKYLQWAVGGLLFVAISYTYRTSFSIVGKTHYGLIAEIVALINNGVMGYLLIYQAKLGCQGAGIANFISRFLEIAIVIFFAIKVKEFRRVSFFDYYKIFIFSWTLLKPVFKNWFFIISSIIKYFSFVALTAVWTNNYDTDTVAAVGVSYAVSNIMWTILTAMMSATKFFVGTQLGKGDFRQALYNSRRLNSFATLSGIFISLVGVGIAFFLPQVVGLNSVASTISRHMILVYSGVNIFYIISMTLFAALEAGNVTLASTLCFNFFQAIFILPLAIILTSTTSVEFIWIFAITQLLQIIPAALGYFYYHRYKWLKQV